MTATLAVWAVPRGIGPYIRQHFLDTTFRGLYRANAFDVALLVPYFIVLVLLAGYGMHRYRLVYLYYKHRDKRTTEPAAYFEELPQVTVQLPIFNEQYVVERLLESICKLKYPREKLEIQVLDDSTDETAEVARGLVERYAALGNPISYHHRSNRAGFKAGALAEGLKTAQGQFIAIFDADFTPPEDFLMRTIHHLRDAKVGMVQTRWTHLNRHYSFLTEVEAILLDGHFVLEHSGRARTGLFFNFNGTAGMWRRATIDDAGGWQHDTLTEDTDLSYRAQLKGWKFIYLQDVECPAELPVEMTAFKTQQARWAKGLIQTGKKILPRMLRSDAPLHTKIEAWYHLTANLSYPLMIMLSVLLLPAMIIRFYQGWFQMLLHRLASVHGVDVFDFKLLPGLAARTVSAELAAGAVISAVPDGAGNRIDHHQHQGGDGGAHRQAERVCANAQVQRDLEARQNREQEVSQAAGMGSVAGVAGGHVFRTDGLLRGGE